MLVENTKSIFENVSDERIDIYYDNKLNNFTVDYENKGITKLNLTLHPEKQILIPLENIFKQYFISIQTPISWTHIPIGFIRICTILY